VYLERFFKRNSVSSILDLEIFVKVSQTDNMSAAGRELGLSPAVVSKHISSLEEKLQVRLFQRTTRQLCLTEEGERYYEHVVKALRELYQAEKSVQLFGGVPQGIIKLTAPTIFSRLHMGELISEFLQAYPKIELDINLTDEVTDVLSEGYDLAIRIGVLKNTELVEHPLATNARVLCAHSSYLKRHGVPTVLQDLHKHNCLVLKSQNNWILSGPNGRETIQVNGNLRSNSSDFIHGSMLLGQGIALRSTWEVSKGLQEGYLKAILPEYVGLDDIKVHIVHPAREVTPAKIEAFVNFTKQKFLAYNNQNGALNKPFP